MILTAFKDSEDFDENKNSNISKHMPKFGETLSELKVSLIENDIGIKILFSVIKQKIGPGKGNSNLSFAYRIYKDCTFEIGALCVLIDYLDYLGYLTIKNFEKLAFKWAKQKIFSTKKAIEYVDINKKNAKAKRISSIFFDGNKTPFTANELEVLTDFSVNENLYIPTLIKAYNITLKKIKKVAPYYIRAILKNWGICQTKRKIEPIKNVECPKPKVFQPRFRIRPKIEYDSDDFIKTKNSFQKPYKPKTQYWPRYYPYWKNKFKRRKWNYQKPYYKKKYSYSKSGQDLRPILFKLSSDIREVEDLMNKMDSHQEKIRNLFKNLENFRSLLL